MNKTDIRDFIANALVYFDDKNGNNKIRLIDFTSDYIIIITSDNKKYLLNLIDLDKINNNVGDMENLIEETEGFN